MITYQQALDLIAAQSAPLRTERIGVVAAVGRVLAEPVRLLQDQPRFDRVTMDGFAVVPDGENRSFRIVGQVLAGSRFAGVLKPGEAVRIMTGAPCPPGATVVPIELTDHAPKPTVAGPVADPVNNTVTIRDPTALKPGLNIAWQGEDGRAGMVVLEAGTRISPVTVALAAAAGATELVVRTQPTVAVITTGDEVGQDGATGIVDSNGPFLEAFLTAVGLRVVRSHAHDDGVALRAALVRGLEAADLVVTTGGVGIGDKDLVPVLAPSLGFSTIFHEIAIQPGKPAFLAKRGDGRLLLGLPGNPVAVLATAHLLLLPLLHRLHGLVVPAPLRATLANAQRGGRRHRFLPGRRDDGTVSVLPWNGSGDLIAAAAGDCLVSLPLGEDLPVGAAVVCMPYVASDPAHHGVLNR